MRPDTIIELIAVITGIVSVIFSVRRHVLTYPIGLVSVVLYIYLCFTAGIYADMGVNLFFGILSISGWIAWHKHADSNHQIAVQVLRPLPRLGYVLVVLLFWIVITCLLHRFTDSKVPALDASVTALSIVGMILMNARAIEHWIIWILVNAISIPLFWIRGLELTSLQFLVLLILAVQGFWQWRMELSRS